jgi:hypothetical protein
MATGSLNRASWGVTHTGTAQGVYTDVSQGADPILSPLHNELGQVIGQAYYDSHYSGEYTILVKAGVALPAKGSTITIGSVSGYVTNVRLMESNQQYQRAAVSIEKFEHCDTATPVTSADAGDTTL